MEKRLSWSIVKEHFSDQWIELADYRWDWEAPHPAWVIVGSHAAERAELISLIADRTLADHQMAHPEEIASLASTAATDTPSSKSDVPQRSSFSAEPVILFVGATHAVAPSLSASV